MLNEILGAAARYQQGLTRRFGLTGGAPSPQLTPEVSPVVIIPEGEEVRIINGEVLGTGFILQVGVAAERSVLQLGNPEGSNTLVDVSHIELVTPGVAGYLHAGICKLGPVAGLPAAGGVSYRDTRTKSGANYTREPTAFLRKDTEPPFVVVANLFQRYVLQLELTVWDGSCILAPGWSVMCVCQTVAQDLFGSFQWREIPLAAGEVGPF